MPGKSLVTRSKAAIWLWALLPMLLAAGIAIPELDRDAFNGDEPFSLYAAGAMEEENWSLADVRDHIIAVNPQQGMGWPMLLSAWGPRAGWDELSIRSLSLFAGILTLALVYRTGREFFSPAAGLAATFLLTGSVFFHAYMVHARAFTLVSMFAGICILAYWRSALVPGPFNRRLQAALLVGATGLLFWHYYGALLLPALMLFHIFFVPRGRQWWRVIAVFGLALLIATVQLSAFLGGLDATSSAADLKKIALTNPEVMLDLVHHITNGLLRLPASFGVALVVALTLATLITGHRLWRQTHKVGPGWFLLFIALALVSLVLLTNHLVPSIGKTRIRYFMPVWPLTALLAGAGLWRLLHRRRQWLTVLLLLWLVPGAYLFLFTDFRYGLGAFRRTDIHRVYRVLESRANPADMLVTDSATKEFDRELLHVRMQQLPFRIITRGRDDPLDRVLPLHAAHPFVWLLFNAGDADLLTTLRERTGLVHCERVVDEWGFVLERLSWSAAHCSAGPVRLQFTDGIGLTGSRIILTDGLLRLEAGLGSEDSNLLARYSIAIHVINPLTGERVGQGDVGVGPGSFIPLSSTIDVSELSAGDYEVQVALYDWQTGDRLNARDLQTGAVSDIHVLHRFHIPQ